jgi:hypothetical protein
MNRLIDENLACVNYINIYIYILHSVHSFIHSFIHSSVALQPFVGPWPLLQFRNLFLHRRYPTQGRYLHTGQHRHRINAYTDILALSGIRTNDPRVRASEDSSCRRPRGHCDRHMYYTKTLSLLRVLTSEINRTRGYCCFFQEIGPNLLQV